MSALAEKYPIVKEAFANPHIQEAMTEFHHFQADPKIRELARQRRLFMMDVQMGLAASREEGFAEGEAKGKAKGKAEGFAETARKMKQEGFPVDAISRLTGLPPEEIKRLS